MRIRLLTIALMAILTGMFIISCGDDDSNGPTDSEAPKITEIIPAETSINKLITISGEDFGDSRGTSWVEFNGDKADTDYYFSSWSDTEIRVFVPENAQSGEVKVVSGGKKSNGFHITISADKEELKIVSLQPNEGKPGDVVQIYGSGFGSARGENKVEFCGVTLDSEEEFGSWTDTRISVIVPQTAVTGKVYVIVSGERSNGADFTVEEVKNPPKITGLSAPKAKIGEEIEISGENFGDTKGGSFVRFNGTKSLDYSEWTDTKIKVGVPAGAVSGDLWVVVDGVMSNKVNFTVEQITDPDVPFIEYLDNSTLMHGQSLGIIGYNFGSTQGSSYVEFGGIKAQTYISWDEEKIVVMVPDEAEDGTVVVYVNGKASNGRSYTILQQNYIVDEVNIPAGSFTMGNNSGNYDEKPEHNVNITIPFKMSKHEISQEIWEEVMSGSNPSHKSELGPQKPVNQVTFVRACEFCNELSKMTDLDPCYTIDGDNVTCDFSKNGFRLPTEAEWEYAARAGHTNPYFSEEKILDLGWVAGNADKHTHNAGMKSPNDFGLYDIFGNVYEWCWDHWTDTYYSESPANDPRGPSEGWGDRVARGGSFMNGYSEAFPWVRMEFPGTNENYFANVGFRVVRNNK